MRCKLSHLCVDGIVGTALFDDAAAECWFVKARWAREAVCPHYQSEKIARLREPVLLFRQDRQKLELPTWVYALYFLATSLSVICVLKFARSRHSANQSVISGAPDASPLPVAHEDR